MLCRILPAMLDFELKLLPMEEERKLFWPILLAVISAKALGGCLLFLVDYLVPCPIENDL